MVSHVAFRRLAARVGCRARSSLSTPVFIALESHYALNECLVIQFQERFSEALDPWVVLAFAHDTPSIRAMVSAEAEARH